MELSITERGFPIAEFVDRYGAKCSIQKSSLAFENCIWLGVDNADPKIMASGARRMGIETEEQNGWVPYPIPKEVLLTTRMHLTVDQVRELLPLLNNFVKRGELYDI